MAQLSGFIFMFSLWMITSVFILIPAALAALFFLKGRKNPAVSSYLPRVSLIIAARNAGDLMENKLNNAFSLNYPRDKFEVVLYSDGSTDDTVQKATAFEGRNIRIIESPLHEGKNSGLNNAAKNCSGEVLVFTDADVELDSSALLLLVRHFGDPCIGGVCGNKIIIGNGNKLESAQDAYTSFARFLKILENNVGSVSSNDGTLYAIRKELYKEIPPAVTDDMYVCLSVVKQNYRFIFEPDAKAFMETPSKNTLHELQRRRRIVSTSIRGIFANKELLNPFKYGIFSLSLITNKLLRRLLPVFLALLFFSSFILSFYHPAAMLLLIFQAGFYISALSYPVLFKHFTGIKLLNKASAMSYYFCIGNYGTLLGLWDFLRGRQITKW